MEPARRSAVASRGRVAAGARWAARAFAAGTAVGAAAVGTAGAVGAAALGTAWAVGAAAACAAAALAGAGCGGDARPPPPPALDFGPPGDAAGGSDAEGLHEPDLGGRPDGGPTLPPADLEVTLPLGAPPVAVDLEADAALGRADIVLSIDTTGSFGGEIRALQAGLLTVVVPRLQARVSDVAFAVVRFEDVPVPPFGTETDRPFRLVTPLTRATASVAAGVASLDKPLGNGGDAPESGAEALYQIATGAGLSPWVPRFSGASPAGGRAGGVGFREGSLRVVLHVTDAPTHDRDTYGAVAPGAATLGEAIAALRSARVAVVGIASGEPARPYLEEVARATGADVPARDGACATGLGGAPRRASEGRCPLVYDIASDGTGLATTVVDAVVSLLDAVVLREAWGQATDDPGPFVQVVEAVDATPPPGAPPPGRRDARPVGDGVDDTFTDVRAGTRLRLRAHLRNTRVASLDYEQAYRVVLEVRGDGLLLARRTVRVVVPALRPDRDRDAGGGADGGGDAGGGADGAGDAGPPGEDAGG
jgi:hypothetical protein